MHAVCEHLDLHRTALITTIKHGRFINKNRNPCLVWRRREHVSPSQCHDIWAHETWNIYQFRPSTFKVKTGPSGVAASCSVTV